MFQNYINEIKQSMEQDYSGIQMIGAILIISVWLLLVGQLKTLTKNKKKSLPLGRDSYLLTCLDVFVEGGADGTGSGVELLDITLDLSAKACLV